MSVCALIVAAGRGSRVGGPLAKQYLPLAGRPVLAHSLAVFASHPAIDLLQVVIHPDDRALYDAAATEFDLLPPVLGGANRQQSVLNGLESLQTRGIDRVLIHDAARPLLAAATIDACLAALLEAPGAIAAVPLADSLKRGAEGAVTASLDRTGLWRAQTPQAFRYDAILAAHRAVAGAELTDDAAVAERAGLRVLLVPGAEEAFKITTTDDLSRAERLLAARLTDVRVGSGFDVHAFAAVGAPVNPLLLCGVAVPHDRALAGHSDADVGLHALTDALLGAIGAADIGSHFPPTDPQWRGAASDRFLRYAVGLLAARGGMIAHLDVTLICERPKIGPHRAAMCRRIAAIAGVALDRVSVKATTTERLGFTGRGEGIAAQATATVRLP